jgi:hypothetical protein
MRHIESGRGLFTAPGPAFALAWPGVDKEELSSR